MDFVDLANQLWALGFGGGVLCGIMAAWWLNTRGNGRSALNEHTIVQLFEEQRRFTEGREHLIAQFMQKLDANSEATTKSVDAILALAVELRQFMFEWRMK